MCLYMILVFYFRSPIFLFLLALAVMFLEHKMNSTLLVFFLWNFSYKNCEQYYVNNFVL